MEKNFRENLRMSERTKRLEPYWKDYDQLINRIKNRWPLGVDISYRKSSSNPTCLSLNHPCFVSFSYSIFEDPATLPRWWQAQQLFTMLYDEEGSHQSGPSCTWGQVSLLHSRNEGNNWWIRIIMVLVVNVSLAAFCCYPCRRSFLFSRRWIAFSCKGRWSKRRFLIGMALASPC